MQRQLALVLALLLALAATTGISGPAGAQESAADAVVPNASFEEAEGDRLDGWLFQDQPGVRTIVDDAVSRSGEQSLRFDLADGENSRAQTSFAVRPNTDYTIRLWMRAEDASAANWGILIRDAATKDRRSTPGIWIPGADGEPVRTSGPADLDMDWTPIEATFNSGSSSEVLLMLAAWRGATGSVWWDDLTISAADPEPDPVIIEDGEHRWLHMAANLVVDDVDDLLLLVDEAAAAGATGVLFSDSKANNFGRVDYGNWQQRYERLVNEVRARDLEFVQIIASVGFCQALLADNVDLAAAYPVDQTMVVQGSRLVPTQDAAVTNGGFELGGDGNRPTGWDFQDAPGARTFIDTSVARSGNASLRADARDGAMSRLFGEFEVEPNRQYVLSAWFKTDDLTARNTSIVVMDDERTDDGGRRQLTTQNLSLPGPDGRRTFFSSTNGLTQDWTEVRLAFNSLDAETVRIALAVFGGQSGSIWWDDVRVEAAPTLNWINRDSLPQSITTDDGRELEIGVDTSVIDDPLLGEVRFSGTYDTYHAAPEIRVGETAGVSDGDVVRLQGWHTTVTARGQIGCSWNDPEIFDIIETIAADITAIVDVDGFLVNYSEVRTGGAEPFDTAYGSSGAAFAASADEALERVRAVAPDADLYVWSDMFDPFHNARDAYYQVAGSLEGAGDLLDPESVTVVNWWSGSNLRDPLPGTTEAGDPASKAESSVEYFAARGFDQIIGGFYDEDVADNREAWVEAIEGQPNIVGSLYATWVTPRDFSDITPFGSLWWVEGSGT